VLPLSHDEVVHGKCSLITRQPGDYWRQFAGMRSLALYQMTHAGAKLNFMGNEIAQFIEWRYYEGIQYFLANDYEGHAHHQAFVKALNKFYNETPALWQRAYTSDGFEWIDADNDDQCIISFLRHGDDPKDDAVVILNFEVNPYEEFRVGLPQAGRWVEGFNSDKTEFGGSGVTNEGVVFETEDKPWNMRDQSIVMRIPPLGGVVLKYAGPSPKKATKKPAAKAAAKPAAKKATKAAAKPAAKKPATKKTTTGKTPAKKAGASKK
jgi:1,4-alpha-glucan branching enzyme